MPERDASPRLAVSLVESNHFLASTHKANRRKYVILDAFKIRAATEVKFEAAFLTNTHASSRMATRMYKSTQTLLTLDAMHNDYSEFFSRQLLLIYYAWISHTQFFFKLNTLYVLNNYTPSFSRHINKLHITYIDTAILQLVQFQLVVTNTSLALISVDLKKIVTSANTKQTNNFIFQHSLLKGVSMQKFFFVLQANQLRLTLFLRHSKNGFPEDVYLI